MTIFSDITAAQPTVTLSENLRAILMENAVSTFFKDVSPVLMIKTADQTVFLNSKKDGEIVNLYNAIKDK